MRITKNIWLHSASQTNFSLSKTCLVLVRMPVTNKQYLRKTTMRHLGMRHYNTASSIFKYLFNNATVFVKIGKDNFTNGLVLLEYFFFLEK